VAGKIALQAGNADGEYLGANVNLMLLDNGLALYLDTSVADTTYIWNAAITGSMFDNYGLAGSKSDIDDHCVNRFHMAQFTQDFTSAATAYLYVFKQGDTTSTKVFTKALTDATLTDMGNTTHPTQPWYEAPEGYTLCLEIRSDAATAFTTFTVLAVPSSGKQPRSESLGSCSGLIYADNETHKPGDRLVPPRKKAEDTMPVPEKTTEQKVNKLYWAPARRYALFLSKRDPEMVGIYQREVRDTRGNVIQPAYPIAFGEHTFAH